MCTSPYLWCVRFSNTISTGTVSILHETREASSQNKGSRFKRTCFSLPPPALVFLVQWRQEMSLDIKVWEGSDSLPVLSVELSTAPATRWEHSHVHVKPHCHAVFSFFPSFHLHPMTPPCRAMTGQGTPRGFPKRRFIPQESLRFQEGRVFLFVLWRNANI